MLQDQKTPAGPNISTDNEHFFQTDADLQAAKKRALKKSLFGQAGSPITMASKVLSMTLLPVTGQAEAQAPVAFVGESGFSLAQLNLESRSRERELKGHAGPVTCVLYLSSPKGDDSIFTASWDKTIRQWDATTGKTVQVLKGHSDFVKSLAIRVGSDGKTTLFSGSTDATIREWDLETARCVATLKGHRRGVESILLDPSGTILFSGSSDTTIRRWNAQTRQCLEVWEGHLTSIYSLSMNESYLFSGMLLSCGVVLHGSHYWHYKYKTASADKLAKRWDLETGKCEASFTHPDFVKCAVPILDGAYLVTGCRDEHIRVWDMGTDKCVRLVKGHSDEVSCLAVSGQTLWSGSIDGTVRSWDLADVLAGKLSGDATAEEQELLAEEAAAAEKPSLMTAEEEAELADLMDL